MANGAEIIIVEKETIPCEQYILLIKQIKIYQKNLIELLTFTESSSALNELILHSLKSVKEYVDLYKDNYTYCIILTRVVAGKKVLYDIQWYNGTMVHELM